MKRRSSEEVRNLYFKTKKLVDAGATVADACEKTGIGVKSFYNARSRYKNAAPKGDFILTRTNGIDTVETLRFDDPPASKQAFLIYGSPAELAEFARNYHG